MTTPVDPNYARLDQRVTGLESSVQNIATSISEIGKKLDERSRPQWVVLISGAGILVTLLGVIGAAWKAPIDSIVARQERDILTMQGTMAPRIEIDGLRTTTVRELDGMAGRLDRLEDFMFSTGGER